MASDERTARPATARATSTPPRPPLATAAASQQTYQHAQESAHAGQTFKFAQVTLHHALNRTTAAR